MSEEEKLKMMQGLDKITVGVNSLLEACAYLEGEFHFLGDDALYGALRLSLLDAEDFSRELSQHMKG